eukprot:277331-Rhodomonas_salina.1
MHPYYHKWTLFKTLREYRYVLFLDADVLFSSLVMELVNNLINSMEPEDWVIIRDNGPALGKINQFQHEFVGGTNTLRKLGLANHHNSGAACVFLVDMLKTPQDMFSRLMHIYQMHRRYFRYADQTAMLAAFEGHWRAFWPCIPFKSFGPDENLAMLWPFDKKNLTSKGIFFHHNPSTKRCLRK